MPHGSILDFTAAISPSDIRDLPELTVGGPWWIARIYADEPPLHTAYDSVSGDASVHAVAVGSTYAPQLECEGLYHLAPSFDDMRVNLPIAPTTSLSDSGSNICLNNNPGILTDIFETAPVSRGVAVR